MEYGIQMYALRDITKVNMQDAIRIAAEAGYKEVEFAGLFGHDPREVRKMLDAYGLRAPSVHCYTSEVQGDFATTVSMMHAIGATEYVVPEYGMQSREGLNGFLSFCETYIPRLRAEGIRVHYHNHRSEFSPTPEGFTVLSELFDRSEVLFELDTYWCWVAGADPLSTLAKLGDRVTMLHLKDGTREGKGCTVGTGEAPIRQIVQDVSSRDIRMIVESEGLTPDGPTEIRRCMEYLRTLA